MHPRGSGAFDFRGSLSPLPRKTPPFSTGRNRSDEIKELGTVTDAGAYAISLLVNEKQRPQVNKT